MGKLYDKLIRFWVSASMAADELIAAAQTEGGMHEKGVAYEDIVDKYARKTGLVGDESIKRSRIFTRRDADGGGHDDACETGVASETCDASETDTGDDDAW